jgi:hypothetical protein
MQWTKWVTKLLIMHRAATKSEDPRMIVTYKYKMHYYKYSDVAKHYFSFMPLLVTTHVIFTITSLHKTFIFKTFYMFVTKQRGKLYNYVYYVLMHFINYQSFQNHYIQVIGWFYVRARCTKIILSVNGLLSDIWSRIESLSSDIWSRIRRNASQRDQSQMNTRHKV